MVTPSFHLELVREHIKHACPVAFNLQHGKLDLDPEFVLGIKRALDNVPVLTGQGGQFSGDPSFTPFTPHSP